jgi:hypothetical protein
MSNSAPLTPSRTQLTVTLVVAVVSLIAWILLAFLFPVGIGYVHLLLGIGVTLLVRWFALENL